jgi:hypothetical protein
MDRFVSSFALCVVIACAAACGPQPTDTATPNGKNAAIADASVVASPIDAGPPKPPPFTDVQATADRTCATGTDGFAYAWGEHHGEVPTRMRGLRGVKKVVCAGEQTCALDKYGAITCIGPRRGAPTESKDEAEKLTGLPPASDLILTQEGGCAIASGDLWCWRRSRFTSEDFAVVEPVEGVHDVVRMHTDFDDRTCVMRSSGPPVCVSRFPDPRPEYAARKLAGDAGPPPLARTVDVMTDYDGARDVFPLARPQTSCAITKDGALTCQNGWVAQQVDKVTGGARLEKFFDVALGRICVKLESGEARCVPPAEPQNAWTPDPGLHALSFAPATLAMGDGHACALGADGNISCWGHASEGQLGDGTAYEHTRAVKVPGITNAAHLSVGKELTCVALANGTLSCWGAWDVRKWFARDQDAFAPARLEAPSRATAITVGSRLSDMLCIKDEADGFKCRSGDNWMPLEVPKKTIRVVRNGALVTDDDRARRFGRDTGKLVVEQHDIDKAGAKVKDLALDGYCGTAPNGDIVCGHCGACDASEARAAFTRIHGAHKYVQVASLLWRWDGAHTHVCGLNDAGTVDCWTGNEEIPWTRVDRPKLAKEVPFASVTDVVQIASESEGNSSKGVLCALDKRGAVFCAGENSHGERGIGTKDDVKAISPVLDLPPVVEIGVGQDHACARTAAGEVWCWGSNERGGAPDGAPGQRDEPKRVVEPHDPG